MKNLIQLPAYFPEEAVDSGSQSDLDILNDTSDDVKDTKEEVEEVEDTDSEEVEDETAEEETSEEEVEEEATDEDEELARVPYRELKEALKDNPKLLKSLKTAFFREQEFTKRFPTVESADTALENSENFERIADIVNSGDTETFLTELAQSSPKTLNKFAGNFLDALSKVDNPTYIRVTTPLLKNVLAQVFNFGKNEDDENVQNAAKIVNKIIFGKLEIEPSSEVAKGKTEKEQELEEQLNTQLTQKYQSLQTDLGSSWEKTLMAEVNRGLDPTNSLKPGMKKLLAERIIREIDSKMAADSAHMGRMNTLWQRERRQGFTGATKDSMITTLLSRAKQLIPQTRQEIRKEVFGLQKSKDSKVTDNLKDRKRDLKIGSESRVGGKSISVKEARSKRMSDRDILNS